MQDLQGRIAIVTGASRGLGRNMAVTLATQGAHVVINHRTPKSLPDAEQTLEQVKQAGGQARSSARTSQNLMKSPR